MKKKIITVLFAVLMVGFGVSNASATFTIADQGWYIYKDGVVSTSGDTLPLDFSSSVSTSFSFTSGATSSVHKGMVFWDVDIDGKVNTYFNEYGTTSIASPKAGQSWEIDEPGYTFGDIFTNFKAGTLDNANAVPSTAIDDVSMALGWSVTLAAGQTADLKFTLSDTLPTTGFYLAQTDPDSVKTLYFSSTLDITGGTTPVPVPGALILFASGMAGLVGWCRKVKL